MSNVTIIRPKKTFSFADFKEVWQYKELLYFFTWRDFKVRYKQTAIGILWAIFQPFMTMVVFSLFFGTLLKVPSDGVPYPIFVYTGLLFWQFFSSALSDTSNVLIANQAIITKVYFPRLILPLSSVATKLVDFIIASVILVGMMVYYGYMPNLSGLVILLFLTPVIYPASIAGTYSWILAMNPMTGVIQTARAALLGTTVINWTLIGISFTATAVLLIVGIIFFKKVERYFADII